MYYPLQNITNPIEFLQWTNQLTGYYFGPMVVLGFFFVTFISLKKYESEKAFATASFLSAILCFLLFLINLTSVHHLMITSIMVLVSLFALKKSEGTV